LEELLPWLYLKSLFTGDSGEALAVLFGPKGFVLSVSITARLKEGWKTVWPASKGAT
jgi:hypothetical protein